MSVTKFGVSVEKVVATMDSPSNHQGRVLPERKYSLELCEDFFETAKPIAKTSKKKKSIMPLSRSVSCII
jgi:hypothetical protein